MIEGISKNSLTAFVSLEALPADERLNTLAILFEHWDSERINDGNFTEPEKAYDRNKEVFTPMDCGMTNPRDLAHSFAALAREIRGESDQHIACSRFSDLLEPHIHQTEGIQKALKAFYGLSFPSKLEYMAEMLAQLEGGELLEDLPLPEEGFSISGYEASLSILAYKEALPHGTNQKAPEDYPFELA